MLGFVDDPSHDRRLAAIDICPESLAAGSVVVAVTWMSAARPSRALAQS